MREFLQVACFWGIAFCGALSLWPFPFARKWKSWNLYLPVVALTFYGIYEVALPSEANVEGRMALILALMLFLWLNGIAKVAALQYLQSRARRGRRHLRDMPQGFWQLGLALPLAAGCAFWFWMTMS